MRVVEELCNVLEAVLLNPGITSDRLQKATNLDALTLERYVRALIGAGFVERDYAYMTGTSHDAGQRMRICIAYRRREETL